MVGTHSLSRLGLGALLAAAVSPAFAQTADSLLSIETEINAYRNQANEHLGDYRPIHQAAEGVRIELNNSGDASLNPGRIPLALANLNQEEILELLPEDLIRDINRRIYEEYHRGYKEWRRGYYPPLAYSSWDSRTRTWTRNYYDRWDSEIGSVFFTSYVHDLYIDRNRASRATQDQLEARIQGLPELRARALEAIEEADGFEPEIGESRKWYCLWLCKGEKIENGGDWDRTKNQANEAVRAYRDQVVGLGTLIDGIAKQKIQTSIRYSSGSRPLLEFLAGVGGDYASRPYDSSSSAWQLYFDYQVLAALPQSLHSEVLRRYIYAYFRGARDAKFGSRQGSNGYDYSDDYGTGNGYGYGSEERYGNSTSGRTPRHWESDNGYGNDYDYGGNNGSGDNGYGADNGYGNDNGSGDNGYGGSDNGYDHDDLSDPWNDIGGGSDNGYGDSGSNDTGYGDNGYGDNGYGDNGYGDNGYGGNGY